jgi:predicted MFS family arabinose efflux permease
MAIRLERPSAEHAALSPGLLWLMATACGLSVACGYYNQPLLGDFAAYFHVVPWQAGLVATAAQVGYGAGLLFFLPLGDLVERRRLVVALELACALCLLAVAAAPNLAVLIAAHLCVGLTAISAQILIPFGADMVPASERGKLVGSLMSGLLCGILLARVFAGFVADHFGWRVVYLAGAALMFLLALALRANLPRQKAALQMPYGRLMHSMLELLRTQPALRNASLVSALTFAAFSAFWTTLSFLMTEHFGLGASAAGMFGLVGVLGAAGAPLAGRLSDRKGVGFTVAVALVLTALAFVTMSIWLTLAGLVAGVLLMDLGVQSVQVAAQVRVISLVPEARSRLNTLYMVGRFAGGAAGSALGAAAWTWARWPGVTGFCLGVTAIALAVHFAGRRPLAS